MDKERARFVLRSFRPDGADTQEVDFAEALLLATSDRELGEWLMRERAFDAEFAEALAHVDLPEGLREKVFLAMIKDGGAFPNVDTKIDSIMIPSIAAIDIPEGLRGRIIVAMEHTVNITAKTERSVFGWKKVGIPLAAAAGIAFAFLMVYDDKPTDKIAIESPATIRVEAVQAGFVRLFESPAFSLDEETKEMPHLISYLREKGLPCGGGYLPPGLVGVKGLGCRELVIDGKRGSLICFDTENGTVHLVIFKRSDVTGELPDIEHPAIEQSGDWARASWRKEKYAFSLMAVSNEDSIAGYF